jgi:CBS domain-containing protein
MLCPSCRAENLEGDDICKNCGHDLRNLDVPDAIEGNQSPEFIRTPLSQVPGEKAARVSVADPVALAIRLMQQQNTGCVLVVEGDELKGIITAWDILHKVALQRHDLNALTCGDIMTVEPVLFRQDDSIAVALNKMSVGEFRHIPLMQDGKVDRVVTVTDVFRQISSHLV